MTDRTQIAERIPTKAETRAFRNACRALDKLGKAGWSLYLANDTMNLMDGQAHNLRGDHAYHDRVRDSYCIKGATGGDW